MLPGNRSPRTWLILTILISLTVLCEADSKKSKASSNPRAEDSNEKSVKKAKDREKSFSETDSDDDKKDEHNNKDAKSGESSESGEDGVGGLQSTRGLKPDDFEPEDTKINLKSNPNSDDETEGGESSRRRRSIGSFKFMDIE